MTDRVTVSRRGLAAAPFHSCWLLFAAASLILSGCSGDESPIQPPADIVGAPFPGFPVVPEPADNPTTEAKAELGRYLFYDTRFSQNNTISCGSCHKPEGAFSDQGQSTSVGFEGGRTTRNAPGLTNVAYNTSLFWEGGVLSLEVQAVAPIINPIEMGMNTDTLLVKLRAEPLYSSLFLQAWGSSEITLERVTKSISAFERTLLSGSSPYDEWNRGDDNAISESAKRGVSLFFGEKGDCFHCHGGFNFTDNMFHNNGLDSVTIDEGRYRITNDETDKGKFRTPTLRNIALTGPYMHDGRFATLDQIVRHYNSGGKRHINRDPLMRPLGLSDGEIDDIVAFLESLTDPTFTDNPALQNPWE
jgi:cytochrome c peroxidase